MTIPKPGRSTKKVAAAVTSSRPNTVAVLATTSSNVMVRSRTVVGMPYCWSGWYDLGAPTSELA